MTARLLLYGATGFSGRRLAAALGDLGHRLVLGGRDGAALSALAGQLGVAHRVFGLDRGTTIDHALADIAVVLHAAGPFKDTAAPMIAACLRTGTDYLDLAGEWPVFADALAQDATAQAAGIMLMPGVGFSIVASDCLLALLAARVPDAVKLRLAIPLPHRMSRGSVTTMTGLNDGDVLVRQGGVLRKLRAGALSHDFDFGDVTRRTTAVSWPDVITAPVTTGVPDIEVYMQTGPLGWLTYPLAAATAPLTNGRVAQAALRRSAGWWPKTPPDDVLARAGYVLVAQAVDPWRRTTSLRLHTGDGYSTTTATAAAIARHVLGGDRRDGFQTPARQFGGDFILELGCARLDVPFTPTPDRSRDAAFS